LGEVIASPFLHLGRKNEKKDLGLSIQTGSKKMFWGGGVGFVLGGFVKLRIATVSFALSVRVRLSVGIKKKLGSHRTDFHEI